MSAGKDLDVELGEDGEVELETLLGAWRDREEASRVRERSRETSQGRKRQGKGGAGAAGGREEVRKRALVRLGTVVDELRGAGLSDGQVERCVRGVLEGGVDAWKVRVGECLGWLLVREPSAALPERFTRHGRGTGAHVGGEVTVVVKGGEGGGAEGKVGLSSTIEGREGPHARAREKEDDMMCRETSINVDDSSHQAEREANKAWILAQGWGSESEDESDEREGENEGAGGAQGVERGTTAVAEELAAAKRQAAEFKAAGDKEGQRRSGEAIKALLEEAREKRVMREVNIACDQILARMPPLEVSSDARHKERQGPGHDAGHAREEEEEVEFSFDEAVFGVQLGNDVDGGASRRDEDEVAEALGRACRVGRGKWTGKDAKGVLAEQCKRRGWAAPSYTNLEGKGSGRRFRFSARVSAGKGKGAVVRVFEAPEAVAGGGGGDTQSRAQSVAALFALHALFGEEMPKLALLLPPDERAVWEVLCDRDVRARKAVQADGDAEKLAFLERLLDGGEGDGAGGREEVAAESRNEDGPLDSWEDADDDMRDAAAVTPEFTAEQGDIRKRLLLPTSSRESLRAHAVAWAGSREGKEMEALRAALPMARVKEELMEAVRCGSFTVVAGQPGCGKTTQVPQYLLEEWVKSTGSGDKEEVSIVCTQPRRIAAVSVAERVAAERGERCGETVGYQVRLDAAKGRGTRLLFCTTGILLRRLQGDGELRGVTHVVVDEVHERSVEGDFLLALLRRLVLGGTRPDLRVIAMSATLDAGLFRGYLRAPPAPAQGIAQEQQHNAVFEPASLVEAEGRTFPVSQYFLEDCLQVTGYVPEAKDKGRPSRARTGVGMVAPDSSIHGGKGGRGGRARELAEAALEDTEDDSWVNPEYNPADLDASYPDTVHRALSRLKEDEIDLDLLEEVVMAAYNGLITAEDSEEDVLDSGASAILVFLSGMPSIQRLSDRLMGHPEIAGDNARMDWILPLHSSLGPEEQRKVFRRPPMGVRKVVIATNIAETSITIEDVCVVIDSGRMKETRWDPGRGIASLTETWVSRAAAQQRRGRAGRVRPGVCLSLYTKARFERKMDAHQVPEIRRVPLENLCLNVKVLGVGEPDVFLSEAPEPPSGEAVKAAMRTLTDVGAIEEAVMEERASEWDDDVHGRGITQVTTLGRYLAQLPVDVHVGKVLVIASLLGCLEPALTAAACLSYKSPFSSRMDLREASKGAKLGLSERSRSDFHAMARAYSVWRDARGKGRKAEREACAKHCLSHLTMRELEDQRVQFGRALMDLGFVAKRPPQKGFAEWLDDPGAPHNAYAGARGVLASCLCAGLYPNVARAVHDDRGEYTDGKLSVFLHPSCVASHPGAPLPRAGDRLARSPWLAFHEKVRSGGGGGRVLLRDACPVPGLAVALFGPSSHDVVHDFMDGTCRVGPWVRLRMPAKTGALVAELRSCIYSALGHAMHQVKQTRHEDQNDTLETQLIALTRRLLAATCSPDET